MFKKFILYFSFIIFAMPFVSAADIDFYTYLKQLKINVNKTWNAPDMPDLYSSEVNFKIYKDGSIKDIKLVKSSGNNILDKMALEAVASIGMQQPLPPAYNANSVNVTMQFSSNHISSTYKKVSKKSYKKTTRVVEKRPVKIVKIIYDKSFNGVSNFQDNMIKPVLNLDIQNARKSN